MQSWEAHCAGDTVTLWIQRLKSGDADAAEVLWKRYFQQVVDLARRKLNAAARLSADEEDVALSVFKSICLGAREGRFPRLSDRESLWSLLVAITVHKSIDLLRHANRRKRGGTGGTDQLADARPTGPCLQEPIELVLEHAPPPDLAVQIAEQFELLMGELGRAKDADLVQIAVFRMFGDSSAEIASRLGCARRTVERKLSLIRRIWEGVSS